MRTGQTCAVKCLVKGTQYKTGECPLCKCVCHAFVPLGDYRSIIFATSMGPGKETNDRVGARDWLLEGTNVNRMQQEVSSQMYNEMVSNGLMLPNGSHFKNIGNEGSYAQANHMIANKPSHAHGRELRRMIDQVQHPAGPSFTDIGDMSGFGRASRADKRVTNNHLDLSSFAPQDMSDEDMLQQGIARSNTVSGAGGGHFETQQYAPTNMSEDEMIQQAIQLSTGAGATDAGEEGAILRNLAGRSLASIGLESNHDIVDNNTDDYYNQKMPATTIAYHPNASHRHFYNTAGPLVSSSSQMNIYARSDHPSSVSNSFSTSTAFTPNENGITDTTADDTPMIIVRTRDEVIKKRTLNRKGMNPEERAASAYVVNALSRPYEAPYVNYVNAHATLPTPERADEVMLYAEDDPKRK